MITLICALIVTGSAEQASIQALNNLGDNNEYVGAVIEEPDGQFCVTNVGKGDRDSFEVRFRLTAHEKIVALFHNHPEAQDSGLTIDSVFSDGDIRAARILHAVSYVRVDRTRTIIRFTPGTSSTQISGNGLQRIETSAGDVVHAG